jgi:hypothetical protein
VVPCPRLSEFIARDSIPWAHGNTKSAPTKKGQIDAGATINDNPDGRTIHLDQ